MSEPERRDYYDGTEDAANEEPQQKPRPEPRRRRRRGGGGGVPCPKCGCDSQRPGPWPWYLGTVGAMMCKAVICNDCDHEFDAKKPDADLATRKRNLAIGINLFGALGILTIIGLLALWLSYTMR